MIKAERTAWVTVVVDNEEFLEFLKYRGVRLPADLSECRISAYTESKELRISWDEEQPACKEQ